MVLPGPVLPSEVWKNRPNTSDAAYHVPRTAKFASAEAGGLIRKTLDDKKKDSRVHARAFLYFYFSRLRKDEQG